MNTHYALEDIDQVAKKFAAYVKGHSVIAFHGNLGAGKTTFIRALCHQLGVTGNVSSPTFSIINRYVGENDKPIIHIDLYRVKDDDEAMNAGVEECIYSGDRCLIEWPERISFLPGNAVEVFIETVHETERNIVCKLPQ